MLNEGVKAQHTKRYVSISLSEEQCEIYQSEQFLFYGDKGNYKASGHAGEVSLTSTREE